MPAVKNGEAIVNLSSSTRRTPKVAIGLNPPII